MLETQQALAAMRATLAKVRAGHILKTELVSEGTRTYERVVNGWRIEELEQEVADRSRLTDDD